jgi:hypothetical protein
MELEYEFEDLGFDIGGGWQIGTGINGKCVVGYDRIGSWWIEAISVEIHKTRGAPNSIVYMLDVLKPAERKWYFELRELITKSRSDAIQREVDDALPITYSNVSHISAGRSM